MSNGRSDYAALLGRGGQSPPPRPTDVPLPRDRGLGFGNPHRRRRALLDGLIDYDTGAAELRRLEAELDSLEEPSQRVDNALFASEQLSDIRDLWALMRPEEQQRFIRLVLDCVVIDSDTGVVAEVVPNGDFAANFDVAAEDEGSSLGVVTWRPRAGLTADLTATCSLLVGRRIGLSSSLRRTPSACSANGRSSLAVGL